MLNKIINTIYPQYCPVCGNEPQVGTLCYNCVKIYISGQKAVVINKIIVEKMTPFFAVDDFNLQIRRVIHHLKYKNVEKYAADIFRVGITPFYDELKKADIITFVPLHPFRLLRRGYNQAEILAKIASRELQIPCFNLLSRVRYNFTQTNKNKNKRIRSAVGLFVMKKNKDIVGKTVIIVDDVCTTSATASECVSILYKNGAKKVIVVCLSKT